MERNFYDPYGRPRHHFGADVTGNGDASGGDNGVILTAWNKEIDEAGYVANADLNRDGVINGGDQGALFADWRSPALAEGLLSEFDNIVGFDGYIHERETGMCTVRNRALEPILGRWGSRDPAGLIDGANLYQYVGSSPTVRIDPFGLYGGSTVHPLSFWQGIVANLEMQGLSQAQIVARLLEAGCPWEMIAAVIGGSAIVWMAYELDQFISENDLPLSAEAVKELIQALKDAGVEISRSAICQLADNWYNSYCKPPIGPNGQKIPTAGCKDMNPRTGGTAKCDRLKQRGDRAKFCAFARAIQVGFKCPSKSSSNRDYTTEIATQVRMWEECRRLEAECRAFNAAQAPSQAVLTPSTGSSCGSP